jgi:glycerophosphoryl diester phosphodiesterase
MAKPLILAHRGMTQEAPENTYESVVHTLDKGIDGLEIDIRPTADGELVCMHDDNAARLAGIDKKIIEMSSGEIRQLTIQRPSLDGKRALHGRPLFLPELLDLTCNHLLLNIEIKGSNWKSPFLLEKFIKPLRDRDMAGQVIVSSFHYQPLMRLRRIAPEIRTGFLIHPARPNIGQPGWSARWLRLYSIHPPKNMVNPLRIAKWRQYGYSIFVWTVNDKKLYDQLCDWGIDGVISDVPESLRNANPKAASV